MNDQNSNSILVIGTRGVGKTTLLTVLGYKFAKQQAFGLSMVPCDDATRLHVRNVSRQMVINHQFPAATDVHTPKAMSWNVMAGVEPLYRLSTLDVGGELVAEVFGGSSDAKDPFDGSESESKRKATETLCELADRAKAVCLVLAPDDLPENRTVRSLGNADELKRFDEIDDLIHAVAHSERFNSRKLVVALTRTDDIQVQEEMASLGGPRGYLRRKCPATAASKRFDDAHVVAVAPVVIPEMHQNAADGAESIVKVPENFDSSGLEDLLVALGGAVAEVTTPVADLAEKSRLLRKAEWRYAQELRAGAAADRLAAARHLFSASTDFETSVKTFLSAVSADADIIEITKLSLLGNKSHANQSKALEEAIASSLTNSRVPYDENAFFAFVLDAARHAAEAVAGQVSDNETFHLTLPWVVEQRTELSRVRKEREKAVIGAIKTKNRAEAEKAFQNWLDIAPSSNDTDRLTYRRRIDAIRWPLTPEQKKASTRRRVFFFLLLVFGAFAITAIAIDIHESNTLQAHARGPLFQETDDSRETLQNSTTIGGADAESPTFLDYIFRLANNLLSEPASPRVCTRSDGFWLFGPGPNGWKNYHWIKCRDCGGDGILRYVECPNQHTFSFGWTVCNGFPNCGGSGRLPIYCNNCKNAAGFSTGNIFCPDCKGSGQL